VFATSRTWNAAIQVEKPSKIIWERVPSSAMAEQGHAGGFHLLRVASTCFGSEAYIGHLQERECTNTNPKTIENYMKKSA
jgi:hypothetical protein